MELNEFPQGASQSQKIYNHLKSRGVDVYFPAMKKGECSKPYVVVKAMGSNQFMEFSTDIDLYDLICYVPQNEYSTLEEFVQKIQGFMAELFPMIKHTRYKSPSFYDDAVKGHQVSIQYSNYKKFYVDR